MNMKSTGKSRMKHILPLILTLQICCAIAPARADAIIHDNDRIVFCGDSITGHTGNGGGWVSLIRKGLMLTHPAGKYEMISLGGSGATLGAWVNMEKKSREEPLYLDVKDFDVKATLDAGADVIIIMLGMNDVLSPGIKNTPADFDSWAERYKGLIETLKARSHPRVIGLATIPPCTEDEASPKNKVEAELNTRLRALAKEENALILPTHEAAMELLAMGRGYTPDFHVTADFVHPNGPGSLAIAVGMLRGLGENDAAAGLLAQNEKLIRPAETALPALSYSLAAQPGSPDDLKRTFKIHYQWTGTASSGGEPVVTATVPDGWKVTPARLTGSRGDFQASGPLDRLENKIILKASAGALSKETEIDIPAGWRLAVAPSKGLGWDRTHSNYDPSQDPSPLDQVLTQDEAWAKPVAFPLGDTPAWQVYIPSVNFTGFAAPGNVDMAAVTYFKINDLVCGARWIWSDKERPVDVTLGSRTFAGNFCESVWLNGDSIYSGKLLSLPGRKFPAEAKLHRGWNRLWFKSTFVQWQWEFTIDVSGKPGDDLADLRYATKPPEAAAEK